MQPQTETYKPTICWNNDLDALPNKYGMFMALHNRNLPHLCSRKIIYNQFLKDTKHQ